MQNKEKKYMLVFLFDRRTAKGTAIARDKVQMKVEKGLKFWVEDMNRKRVTLFIMLVLYNYFNVGTALPCVICQFNLAIFTYVTRISRYTGCPRRNVPDFGRVFLRSNYTDITQNAYIQSSMVTKILAREKCGLLWCLRTILCP